MNMILSAYSENSYKEFRLPRADNIRTRLVLRRDVFGLAESLDLLLENEDGVWYISPDNAPGFIDPQHRERPMLCDGDHFLYQAGGRTLVYFTVQQANRRLEHFPRYPSVCGDIHIGAPARCDLP